MLHKITSYTDYLSRNRRGCLCVLGSFLLSLALSLDYSYPNLNTYITSYLRTNGSVIIKWRKEGETCFCIEL